VGLPSADNGLDRDADLELRYEFVKILAKPRAVMSGYVGMRLTINPGSDCSFCSKGGSQPGSEMQIRREASAGGAISTTTTTR
jgi:hypothetical protein